MDDKQIELWKGCNVPLEPSFVEGWRGRCNIPSREKDVNISAHLLHNPNSVVWKLASTMPDLLCLKQFPRLDVWPAYFNCLPPTEFSIDLLFYSEGSDEKLLDDLLNDAICSDFALKANMGVASLLIFTSLVLPERLRRFEGKFYFWGLFIGQNALFLPKKDNNARVENNEPKPMLTPNIVNNRTFVGESSSLTHGIAQVGRKRGRQFDDAWKHCTQLDFSKRKLMCNYCGFVSTGGGISRIKAHLAGGISTSCLPGCSKVSPEIKHSMASWFREWVKTTKITWALGGNLQQ